MNTPTADQLKRLQAAHLKASRATAAVTQARVALDEALARDGQAQAELSTAIAAVLYGEHEPNPAR
ncbi:hypothetical protein B0E38_06486 [Streptomyces sp. 111WW2]|uniref:hypothetical protein n=1 Tax=Streptomyces sp. 111WW2 TaxID=1945515 RepID=UPI000D0C7E2E|nr:hypothetical protein [Streptomyces sp. 111WW2]PSK48009.1 hypothetical protein B0E38_06486 [Streptomyces sp. 111WW2]